MSRSRRRDASTKPAHTRRRENRAERRAEAAEDRRLVKEARAEQCQ